MNIFLILVSFLISFNVFPKGAKRPKKPKKSRSFVNRSYSPCINYIESKFSRLKRHPNKINHYRVNSRVFRRFGYRMHLFNKNRLGLDNHIQALVKLKGKHNFLFSGGDRKRKEAHLFVLNRGRIIKKMIIGRGKYWHPTGMQTAGDILPIYMENFKGKKKADVLKFFDIRDPKNPKLLPLKMSGSATASTSIFRRRSDGKYILNLGYHVAISKTSNILNGFRRTRPLYGFKPGESHSLIQDCKSKRLYFVTFNATGKLPPLLTSADVATLYRFNLNEGRSRPTVKKIKEKKFKCGLHCSFDAGTTIVAEKGRLSIYSVYHYRRWFGNKIPISEFR